MDLKLLSAKWWPFCSGLDVLIVWVGNHVSLLVIYGLPLLKIKLLWMNCLCSRKIVMNGFASVEEHIVMNGLPPLQNKSSCNHEQLTWLATDQRGTHVKFQARCREYLSPGTIHHILITWFQPCMCWTVFRKHIENNVCSRVAKCLCTHERVI